MNKETTQLSPTLSIRISTDGFCFCTYLPQNPDSVTYIYHECDKNISLRANFDAAWQQHALGEKEYANIQVIKASNNFTAIPSNSIEKEEYTTIYRSCFPDTSDETKILTNKLSAQNITILFDIPIDLHERLCSLGETSYYSPISIIIGFFTRYKPQEERYVVANLQNDNMLLIGMEEETPLLMNGFHSESIDDKLYYLLCIWNEMGLSQEEESLLLCGDTSADKLQMLAQKFIRNIRNVNSRELFRPNLLNKIENIPFDLQALILCE